MRLVLLAAILGLVLPLPRPAEASFSVSGYTGKSFISGEHSVGIQDSSWFLGTEATYHLSVFDVGLFYDQNFIQQLQTGESGNHQFYGILGRVGLGPNGSILIDVKLGLSQRSLAGKDYNPGLGYGFGLGYKYEVTPFFSFGPRFGFRILNTASDQTEPTTIQTTDPRTGATTITVVPAVDTIAGTMLDFGMLFSFSL